ncbi:phage protein [[Clostridium] sordellii]|nr:phage protein [[Clostridium] sordellii] [Paeniclostridium sordellii]
MALRLCAGASTIPVEVCPNSDLSTTGKKIPFIIGDLKEGIVFWDRALMNIKMSDTAAIGDLNAFEEDLTLFRAIEREDVTIKDKAAIVNGYIDTTAVSSEH